MNFKMFMVLFVLLGLPRGHAFAQVQTCSDLGEDQGAFFLQRLQGQKNCYVSATPLNGVDYYRSTVFTDEGMFMVFNSYEYNKASDGARVFFFFPRTQIPSFAVIKGAPVIQTATPGIQILLHPTKAVISGMNGGVLKEDSEVQTGNNGGVEISNIKTLWLDAGFKMGADPTADLNRISRFTDARGKTCVVKNSEIFSSDAGDDSFFRFTDAELKTFLKNRCPALEFILP